MAATAEVVIVGGEIVGASVACLSGPKGSPAGSSWSTPI